MITLFFVIFIGLLWTLFFFISLLDSTLISKQPDPYILVWFVLTALGPTGIIFYIMHYTGVLYAH